MKVYINENQYLSDVLPVIPSNTVLRKKITGCGATRGEIKANRHSIIIEPTVPVIKGKCSKHGEDNLFGVHEGVYTTHVVAYLRQSMKANKLFKILATPESFQKVKEAFEILGVNMHEECFLLFDECHKIVKDVDYREDITLPFDDFFQFKNKALVSATLVEFSDPRFKSFEVVEIEPTYDVRKTLHFCPTNNVLEATKKVIEHIGSGKICFFINSTDVIDSMMNALGIKEESTVFCAPKSVERLNERGFMNARDNWSEDNMKRYNFFTSRFFCALDIEMEERPHVIMVTDLSHATHSMLDPRTDVWQIAGRFRNGISGIYHVASFNSNYTVQSVADLKEQVTIMENVYYYLLNQYNHASSRNARIVYMDTLKSHPYKKFLDKEDRKNWSVIDNYVDEGLVTSMYNSEKELRGGYERVGLYKVVPVKGGYYKASEKLDKLTVPSKFKSIKEKKKAIVEQLEAIKDMDTELKRQWRDSLHATDPCIVEAHELLGKEVIEKLAYSNQKIKEAMIVERYKRKTTSTAFIELMKNTFHVGAKYEVERVKTTILSIHEKLDIAPLRKVTAHTINELFETRETWVGKASKRKRALYIVKAKV